MFERVKKAQEILDEALIEEIPTHDSGQINVTQYRKRTYRNQQAGIIVINQLGQDFKTHVESNRKTFKIMSNVGISAIFIFAIAIVGIHTSWTIAGGVSVVGGVGKALSYLFIK